MRVYMNDDWLFAGEFKEEMCVPDYPDTQMKKVRLPHSVVETPFHYFDESCYQMVSCYRRHFKVKEGWRDKQIRLVFEGAAHDSSVYLNGEQIAQHHCGYTAFTVDITDQVCFDRENVLVIRLDSRETLNEPPFGFVIDYMTYGGIYREVYLEITDKTYMEDVFLRTVGDAGAVKLHTTVEVKGAGDKPLMIRAYLTPGVKVDRSEVYMADKKDRICEYVAPEKGETIDFETDVPGVELWSPTHPALYTVHLQLMNADTREIYDERTMSFGFRFSEFREDGYYLNGEKVRIRGLNRHQSYPYVGYAMPASMQELDARILKTELLVNAVRTSHYPQSHAFIDACDRLGLLVFTEIPGWQHIGDASWKEQAVRNTEDMVRQYRNHPSIILWGVRINESADDDEFYRRTNEAAHALDPSRPTGGVRAHKQSHLFEDVYTYNDFVHDGKAPGCTPRKDVTPDRTKPYLVTEYNGHMYPTKSFDDEEHRREHAIRHANVLDAVAGEEGIAGSFAWCMFDYNTHKDFGSGDRICYHGVTDMFRNPKMASLVYASEQEDVPVLEISSSMDIGEHPASNRGDTWIFTNAESVKMYKNDRLLKEYAAADSPYKNLRHGPILIDDFVGNALVESGDFKPAQAKAVKELMNLTARHGTSHLPLKAYLLAAKLILCYRMTFKDAVRLYNQYVGDWGSEATTYRFEAIRDGKVVKTVTKTAVKDMHLEVKADHKDLVEGTTYDVAAVRFRMLDEHDNLLPYYQEPIVLEVEGSIELIGPHIISLKGGMGGTYVRTTGRAGIASLKITTARGEQFKLPFTIKGRK